ncbi:MAG: hypothetical protein V3V19_08985 [Cocleimonas sp.]
MAILCTQGPRQGEGGDANYGGIFRRRSRKPTPCASEERIRLSSTRDPRRDDIL